MVKEGTNDLPGPGALSAGQGCVGSDGHPDGCYFGVTAPTSTPALRLSDPAVAGPRLNSMPGRPEITGARGPSSRRGAGFFAGRTRGFLGANRNYVAAGPVLRPAAPPNSCLTQCWPASSLVLASSPASSISRLVTPRASPHVSSPKTGCWWRLWPTRIPWHPRWRSNAYCGAR